MWIESHQGISRHPKTEHLARLLNEKIPAIVGHLHILWHWCLDFAPDGNLTRYHDNKEAIAKGAMWEKDSHDFLMALIAAGFVDVAENDIRIHDWEHYGGRLVAIRQANAERQRRCREEKRASPRQ